LEQYEALQSFTQPPLSPSLPQWMKKQRYLKSKGCLSEQRQNLLNELFEKEPWLKQQWNVTKKEKSTWMEQYTALKKFQQENWHCRVPYTSSLGRWVQKQRTMKDSLTVEQERMLNELGFQWSFPTAMEQ